jgi:hypothetical protein
VKQLDFGPAKFETPEDGERPMPKNDTWGEAFSNAKGLKASELDRSDSRKRRDENGYT